MMRFICVGRRWKEALLLWCSLTTLVTRRGIVMRETAARRRFETQCRLKSATYLEELLLGEYYTAAALLYYRSVLGFEVTGALLKERESLSEEAATTTRNHHHSESESEPLADHVRCRSSKLIASYSCRTC